MLWLVLHQSGGLMSSRAVAHAAAQTEVGGKLECVRGKRDSDGKHLTKRATEKKKNKSEHFCKTSCTELEKGEI